jgi:copper chaperone CopZ
MKKLSILLLLIGLFIGGANAQMIKVDQTVFGMDCAPCAYGLERGLKNLDGIEKVKVSLNDGKAYLNLASDNALTLQKMQEEVKSNGFSARDAKVSLKGRVVKNNNQLILKVNQESFLVSPESAPNVLNKIKTLKEGESVKVEGEVAEEEEAGNSWKIRLTEVS